jgi:hypothetical protein
VGDADNSPTFRHGYVRELPYIQPLWKRYCDNFANKAVENLEDIQGNLDDDIGVEHIVNANAGLLANAVRGLSPWAATSLRAEQRLEFQVSCARHPAACPAARCRMPRDAACRTTHAHAHAQWLHGHVHVHAHGHAYVACACCCTLPLTVPCPGLGRC